MKSDPTPPPIDNPPTITSIQIKRTHNDPARLRKYHTFFFDFTLEAIDDNDITSASVNIVEPGGDQTTINLMEVSGIYYDSFQAWDEGTYVFQFKVVDNVNQNAILETNRTIVYETFDEYMQTFIAKGWSSDFLLDVYQLNQEEVERLYGTPSLENYLENMLKGIGE